MNAFLGWTAERGNRGSTEEQKRGGAADKQNSINKETSPHLLQGGSLLKKLVFGCTMSFLEGREKS
jgi:hypothetical protein